MSVWRRVQSRLRAAKYDEWHRQANEAKTAASEAMTPDRQKELDQIVRRIEASVTDIDRWHFLPSYAEKDGGALVAATSAPAHGVDLVNTWEADYVVRRLKKDADAPIRVFYSSPRFHITLNLDDPDREAWEKQELAAIVAEEVDEKA